MFNTKSKKQILYSDRRQMRMMLVMFLYKYELTSEEIDLNNVFESDELNEIFTYKSISKNKRDEIYKDQLKLLSEIHNNYYNTKKIIQSYIREDWTWERIMPMVRSILICATTELKSLDVAIVANEYVEITKDFIPNTNDYRFVNKIIELIGKVLNEHNKKN